MKTKLYFYDSAVRIIATLSHCQQVWTKGLVNKCKQAPVRVGVHIGTRCEDRFIPKRVMNYLLKSYAQA